MKAAMIDRRRPFEIWIEGYAATGGHGEASMLGVGYGDTFEAAAHELGHRLGRQFKTNEAGALHDWGCRLFDNEQDARKGFD
jgi:hypothetical protein